MLRPAAHPGPRPAPVVVSLIVHLSLLGLLAFSPRPSPKPLSAYQREIAPQEKKLVWYRFNDKLPDVSPPKPAARPRPPRALQKHPSQTIVAKSSRPDPAKQLILAPGPELKVDQELKAPNLMAFEAPKPPDPLPAPKLFMPPPEAPRPVEQPVLEAGPALPTESAKPLDQLPAPRPAPQSFVPPAQEAKRIETPQLQPGEIRIAPAEVELNPLARLQLPARPAAKPFAAPQPKARRQGPSPALATGPAFAPPALNAKTAAALPGQVTLPARPQAKVFAPPQQSAKSPRPVVPPLQADNAPASNLSAAVVGLNPMNTFPVVPEGSRPAQFSAAPEISPKGDGGGAASSSAIKMEDLMISGGTIKKDALPKGSIVALTRVNPTSNENLLAAARAAPSRPAPLSVPKPSTGAPVRVSSAPDRRLDGRIVYTVAINMPNVTSYSGSWILWYAERQPGPGEERRILPPEPLRKVDPIYDLSAMEDQVEGKVQLSAIIHKDGYVYGINIVKGLDPRLDNNAVQALRKWEFTPASIEGDPVDVDIVIEIPFRLRPKK
jgi:TonB family protein